MECPSDRDTPSFYGGVWGALTPFAFFLAGVAALGLAGAPDERGFWPVLLGSLGLGLAVARDRRAYAESYLHGMSQPIVMTMVLAWLLAGVLGSCLGASGLIDALTGLAERFGVRGGGFALAAFAICATVSTATGTSLGTILVCGPLLYPAGAGAAAAPPVLIGAILGGATFGDNLSPVSDTTIASSTTQGATMADVVRSRLGFALPAALLAAVAFAVLGGGAPPAATSAGPESEVGPGPLVMLLAPAASIILLLRRRHLVEGLLVGCGVAVAIGLLGGWIAGSELLWLDRESFVARGLLLEGMERAVGISFFTLLLMGLVAPIQAAGVLHGLVAPRQGTGSRRAAELSIFAAVSAAALLTAHSVVAILTVGARARELGEAHGIPAPRRANLLDVTVCTYPFLLPFYIPTILAAATTASGYASGMPRVSPWQAGLHNFHSWALLLLLVGSIALRGRRRQGT
ncbi:MAG: Na+/H+ antiporter NhaC family protein [Planctomycetota bacterium]